MTGSTYVITFEDRFMSYFENNNKLNDLTKQVNKSLICMLLIN
jgi:hypothetical protein